METTQQFGIKEGGFKEIRWTIIRKTGALFLFIIVASLGINFYLGYQAGKDMTTTIFIMIPLSLAIFSITMYVGMKRQEELFQSYTIIVGSDSIKREQKNTPVLEIKISDIKEIYKSPNGAIVIKGSKMMDLIGVPVQIKEFAKVEELLNSIKLITERPTPTLLEKFYKIMPIAGIVLMLSFYVIENKILVVIVGTLLLALLGYSQFEVARSKHIDNRIKKTSWLSLYVMASVLLTLIYKLFYK